MFINKYEKLFNENVVMTIEHLKMETDRPRESILRDLKNIGYYSSYNERGKFYTLERIPKFDDYGLWKYQNAYFSIRRTLLDTIEYLVCVSSAGYTHDELRSILGIGIQNSLYQLTISGKIIRRQCGAQYAYFGEKNIDDQWKERNTMPIEPIVRRTIKISCVHGYPAMDPLLVIDILVAILRGNETDSAVWSYLKQEGSLITTQQVATVFRYYHIGKKNSMNRR